MQPGKLNSLENIRNEDNLLRRIPFRDPNYIKPDGSITSFAFKPRRGEEGLSVNIERLTDYRSSILDPERFKLFFVLAGFIRELGLYCVHSPVKGNPAHALIKGSFTNSICRKMAGAAKEFPKAMKA